MVSRNCCRFEIGEAVGSASLGLLRHAEGQDGEEEVNARAERHMMGAASLRRIMARISKAAPYVSLSMECL